MYNAGSAMPMPNYPAAGGAGAYRPPVSNTAPGYQPYPYPGQQSQPPHMPPNHPPYPGYSQGFAPYPHTTQTGKPQFMHACFYLMLTYDTTMVKQF